MVPCFFVSSRSYMTRCDRPANKFYLYLDDLHHVKLYAFCNDCDQCCLFKDNFKYKEISQEKFLGYQTLL